MTDREVRRRFVVSGRVQGVGFRAWCQRVGIELRVHGTVKNNRDGTVEVEVRGDPAPVESFFQALSGGPGHARVQRVEEFPPSSSELPRGFRIIG